MAYTRINWKNTPSTDTPINSINLNKMDEGIYNADTSINNGWINPNETWTYVSVDDPTGVIKVNADVTTKYSLGMRIKMTNGGNTIFGILTKIGAYDGDEAGYTYLTFLHEIDPTDSLALYLMANSEITENYYSNVKAPFGFPLNPDKWTLITNQFLFNPHQAPTVANVWYNIGGISLRLPIGVWRTNYTLSPQVAQSTIDQNALKCTLSTANNSESTIVNSAGVSYAATLACILIDKEILLTITTPTTFYLNEKTTLAANSIYIRDDLTLTTIRAVCAYL